MALRPSIPGGSEEVEEEARVAEESEDTKNGPEGFEKICDLVHNFGWATKLPILTTLIIAYAVACKYSHYAV